MAGPYDGTQIGKDGKRTKVEGAEAGTNDEHKSSVDKVMTGQTGENPVADESSVQREEPKKAAPKGSDK